MRSICGHDSPRTSYSTGQCGTVGECSWSPPRASRHDMLCIRERMSKSGDDERRGGGGGGSAAAGGGGGGGRAEEALHFSRPPGLQHALIGRTNKEHAIE
ncbi:hypothetical protein MPTK1_2g20780 [Marchantia polymorpha subsp. ruderalis]|uniref:Uncharacterized protein n=1 Tax=Marchantia polymorpha TaxID=3197 RepID=A0A2R6X2Z7_MARPO|nr:hypothetical protein MARPO_0040s0135 [Marchantia polymorpha]BBN03103.1 hypothetical protein Mp_2g20780 [Marchantia polymorpha subsp. ruderalis]|eukprot:PTQ40473.1 hypothetical protein MARPO_0040s0135 [Marchantia polymorpha]